MKTPAQRQADKRQRRKEAGEVRVDVWLPANQAAIVQAFIAGLQGKQDTVTEQ